MTMNQTIDGVPRELLERLLTDACNENWSDLNELLHSAGACRCKRYGKGNPHWPCPVHPVPAAQPHGEPVHQWSDDDGISWCDGNERSLQSAREYGWKTRTLYAEQPAPVAVVLPDLWQPIETAPKDGTEIILRKGVRVTAGAWIEWTKSEAEFHSTGAYLGNYEYDSGASWSSWDGGFCDDDHPTHWQPLPAVNPQQ